MSSTTSSIESAGHLEPDTPVQHGLPTPGTTKEILIAHSPDSDDAFMFYGLATNKIRVPGFKFNHTPDGHRDAQSPGDQRGLLRRHCHFVSRLPLSAGQLRADGLRRQRGRGLRPHGRRPSAVHARRNARSAHRDSRCAHHRVSRAEDLRAGDRDRLRTLRPHHPRDPRR